MKKETKQTLGVIWKHPESGLSFKIGILEKFKKNYYFKYNVEETKKALENEEFSLFPAFPSLSGQYFKESLFSTFLNMVPKNNRGKNTDEFEILKNIGSSNNNNYEFTNLSEEINNLEEKGNED
ncbi:hypothetical protein CLOACE_05600 [Clostridium acetireducens DSM 10703]|jgi:hypothetical protein|uniref:HipA N-terminal subdomain 1 domain-containing protein n=1 Tax=Clostridium acetireducens DSM 10703 TaxID=1121290 RepID=A0A1E8F1B6_9CLOT|nr:hypothetical protein [Clostridium acetireducens]OFI06974.1 hypothetical protein CLOACE_05600 [Clostridium acetireducens DSM 10703]